jgi:hypothetical protein
MNRVRVLSVPYDSGHREQRQGRGPAVLTRYCFADRAITPPEIVRVEANGSFPAEISTTIQLIQRLAYEIGRSLG